MTQFLLNTLQQLADRLFPAQPYQPLPDSYHQQPDWCAKLETLQAPAAWRRSSRVR